MTWRRRTWSCWWRRGGKGGYGNQKFKSSKNRSPRQFGPGPSRRATCARARAQGDRRRGLVRPAERRQVDADHRGFRRASQDRRLSVHHAVSESRRHLGQRSAQLRDGRHPGTHRRRGGWCGPRHPFPQASAAHTRAAASRGHCAHGPIRGSGARCASPSWASSASSARTCSRSRAGWSSTRATCSRRKKRWPRPSSIAVALKYRGPAFLISGATHAGTRDLTEAVMRFLETSEAPAQGNLPLPAMREPKPAKAPAAKKRAAVLKKKAKAKKPAAKRKKGSGTISRKTRNGARPLRKKSRPQKRKSRR